MLVAKCCLSVVGADGTWVASFFSPWPTNPPKWAGVLMLAACAMADLLVEHPSLDCNKGEVNVTQEQLALADTWSMTEKWVFSGDSQHTPWQWGYRRFPSTKGGKSHG